MLEVKALLAFSHEARGDYAEATHHYKQLFDQMDSNFGLFRAILNQRYAGCLLKSNQQHVQESRKLI